MLFTQVKAVLAETPGRRCGRRVTPRPITAVGLTHVGAPRGSTTREHHEGAPRGSTTREHHMASTMRWDPFQDLRAAQVAQDEMNQMTRTLAQALGLASQPLGTAAASATWAPALDIFERKDAYVVTVELPG